MANRYFTLKLEEGRTGMTYTDWEGMANGVKVEAAIQKKSHGMYELLTEAGRDMVLHMAFETADSCDMATMRKMNWRDICEFALYVFGHKDETDDGKEPLSHGKAFAYRDE